MEIANVIIGQVVTEKSERVKPGGTYTLQVAPQATKVDVRNALRKFYDVEVASVRVLRVGPKKRTIGRGRTMEKRHRSKRALVTLRDKSKLLDLTSFKNR